MILLAAKVTAVAVVFVLSVYSLRHFFFAFHRLFRPQRMNYIDLVGFHLPSVSVLIPMHNEEAVAHDVLEALLEADYPHDPGRLEIIPIRRRAMTECYRVCWSLDSTVVSAHSFFPVALGIITSQTVSQA
ncbi:MAG: hypothetical protein ACE1Y4_04135 [Lysobacterales bacterium]